MSGERDYVLVVGYATSLTRRLVGQILTRGHRVAFIQNDESDKAAGEWQRLRELEEATTSGQLWILAGDPVAIDFGLPGSTYRDLCDRVGVGVFCMQPRAYPLDIEQSDVVRAAGELHELVEAGGARRGIVFLSSLLVFGDRRAPVAEADLRVGQSFNGPYEESLAVAEKIIRSIEGRCALTVLRTTPPCGAQVPAEVDPLGPVGELARAVQLSPTIESPVAEFPIRLETEDRIVEALTILTETVEPGTLHLVDRNAPTLRTLVHQMVRHYGKRVEEVQRPRPLLKRNKNPASRVMTGWNLQFDRATAERRLPRLLDPDWEAIIEHWYPAREPAEATPADELQDWSDRADDEPGPT